MTAWDVFFYSNYARIKLISACGKSCIVVTFHCFAPLIRGQTSIMVVTVCNSMCILSLVWAAQPKHSKRMMELHVHTGIEWCIIDRWKIKLTYMQMKRLSTKQLSHLFLQLKTHTFSNWVIFLLASLSCDLTLSRSEVCMSLLLSCSLRSEISLCNFAIEASPAVTDILHI